jgi:hypothetical protein
MCNITISYMIHLFSINHKQHKLQPQYIDLHGSPNMVYVHNEWPLILFINRFLTTPYCATKYAIVISSKNYLVLLVLQYKFTHWRYYKFLPLLDSLTQKTFATYVHYHILTLASMPLSFLYYIFIRTNRAKSITKVDKVSPSPTIYNRFLPSIHCFVVHLSPSSNYILPFDLLFVYILKLIQNSTPTRLFSYKATDEGTHDPLFQNDIQNNGDHVGQLRRGGESVVTVLKQLCFF